MKRFILFDLEGVEFGIDVDRIVEVRNVGFLRQVPDLPDYFPGLMNARGEFIPIMDLRKRFSIEGRREKYRALIVRYDGEKIGLQVDEVKGLTVIENEDIVSPPSVFKGLKTKYLVGLGRKDDKLIILLDLEKLLTSKERIMLETAKESLKTARK